MEEKKHLWMYVEQVFTILGVSLLVVTVACAAVGERGQEYSTMFALGSEGIPVSTVLEYLLCAVCITALRFLFFTDVLLRRWSVVGRIIGMLTAVIALIGVFAYGFGWFPVEDPICWLAFFVSFGICFVLGVAVSAKKEKLENRALEEALRQMKERQERDWQEES